MNKGAAAELQLKFSLTLYMPALQSSRILDVALGKRNLQIKFFFPEHNFKLATKATEINFKDAWDK